MQKLVILFVLVFGSSMLPAQNNNIIPQPASFTYTRSLPFKLNVGTTIGGNNAEAQKVARMLADQISRPTGFRFTIRKTGAIQLTINAVADPIIGDEGYTLNVTTSAIKINANKAAGLFYGAQTLLQLLPPEIESKEATSAKWSIPACAVTDFPRFGWRGLMLDVSRHFFPKEDVKRYIDRMARYKYNVFHWHLTDDEGWRIEIKSLPKLTEVGACRVPRYGKWGVHDAPKEGEAATDCGYYTQEDIKEIVAYAAERHIQVLPEIDVPGHNSAAVASYPELCCTQDPSIKVSPGCKIAEWYGNGQFKMLVDNTLDPSSEQVYSFLDKVFTEVAALFPFGYIHSGGDECYHGYWENDPDCKALMAKEGLKTSHELQSYFTKRVEKIIQSKGKKMIGWDEILEGGLAPDAAVMSWRGLEGGIEAAKLGHYVVMSPNDYVYIDLLQGEPLVEPDQTSYKSVRLQKAYSFEPVPEGIDPKYILGGQANLWTEKVPTIRQAEYMTYPRAWAIADLYWSPKEARNWDAFTRRMENHMERSDVAGINYARSAFDPIVTGSMVDGKLYANIATEVNGLDIYYTLDESIPDKYSPKYTGPVAIPEGKAVTLKVATFHNGKSSGKMVPISRDEIVKRVKKVNP
ncbi:MAG: family 20 glycosylhydrolase [Saprospiraceae bacterium]|nr:family 20 glycosylhydrolase [Saprospiraceae bacterium]